MKKLLLMSLILILTLPGCGKEKSPEAEEADLDAVSASVSGTLIEFTGSEISIETEDGDRLSFDNCSSAALDLKNGIIPGNNVILVYVGGIDGTDTSNTRVRKIITEEDNSAVAGLAKKAEENLANVTGSAVLQAGQDPPASGASLEETNGTGYITGGVNVRIDALSGSEIIGHLGEGDSVTVTGICDNGWYRIAFEGQTGYVWRDYISY